jgi:hypothetical protein
MNRFTSPQWFKMCPADTKELILDEFKNQQTDVIIAYYVHNDMKLYGFGEWIHTIIAVHRSQQGIAFWRNVIKLQQINNSVPDIKEIMETMPRFRKVDIFKHLDEDSHEIK